MFHILGIGFFFILILFIIGLMVIVRLINATGSFIGSIFNPSGKRRDNTQHTTGSSYRQSDDTVSESAPKSSKKVFGEDEGEYVEFEEIKE